MPLSTSQFYLPYQFIPVTGQCSARAVETTPTNQIAQGSVPLGKNDSGARHDLWLANHHSGRLRCSITTRSPTFVGGHRVASDNTYAATEVAHAVDECGQPILPGNSLRGMVASIAETLSQSSLRVLEDRTMSVRQSVRDHSALSAVGLIACDADTGAWVLKPMCLPVLRGVNGSTTQFRLPNKWAQIFGLKPDPAPYPLHCYLSVYFSGYTAVLGAAQVTPGSFLDTLHAAGRPAETYYSLSEIAAAAGNCLDATLNPAGTELTITNPAAAYVKLDNRGNSYLLGWRQQPRVAAVSPVLQPAGSAPPDEILGRVRALRLEPDASLPPTKHHELFLPEPPDGYLIPIRQDVMSTFERLCAARHAESEALPFVPLGTASPAERQASKQWLQEGDMVFFDIDEDATEVTRLSFSSIWRRAVPGSLDESLAAIAPHLPPLLDSERALSPAECLFGMVRERDSSKKLGALNDDALPALASRVRFRDARLVSVAPPQETAFVTLQILSSPKPPSPAFYFSGTEAVSKAQLNLEAGNHRPNGRKYYLHPPQEQIDKRLFESRHNDRNLRKQKVLIKPLKVGTCFEFVIDFENLSDAELNLLLTSLQPSADFHHRLGMGKPLGLGSVRLDILELGLVPRCTRYSADALDAPRYSRRYLNPIATTSELDPAQAEGSLQPWPTAGLARVFAPRTSLVDRTTLDVLLRVGEMVCTPHDENGCNPKHQRADVAIGYPRTYPQLAAWINQANAQTAESELFAWNVKNDAAHPPQTLSQISAVGVLAPFNAN